MGCRKYLEFSIFFVLVSVIRTMIIVEPPFPIKPTQVTRINQGSLEHPLDLAFVMDSTGSMTSYIDAVKQNINRIVEEIVKRSQSQVRLALVEYRDHPPQDNSFVTRIHDFTDSVSTMKSWLDKAAARGGGDSPEAVADALFNATKLSWNVESTKISILISDAPPHALDPSRDSSFHNGCPSGHDPMESVRDLAKIGVTLYSVGCEPSINKYKDFFEALAFITGGQYVPMRDPGRLINVIIGGAEEELSLQQFSNEVEKEFERVKADGGEIDENQIASTVYKKLKAQGAKSMQLTKNSKTLKGPSTFAKTLSDSSSMADVREKYVKERKPTRNGHRREYGRRRLEGRRFLRRKFGARRKHKKSRRLPVMLSSDHMPYHSESSISARGPHEMPMLDRMESVYSSYPALRPVGALKPPSRSSDAYSTVESDISLGQIKRLVKKESSKLKAG